MFFILSKLLSFLLKPLTWIILCILAGVLWKKSGMKKLLIRIGLLLLVLFTNPWLANQVLKWWEAEPVLISALTFHDVAIILTGVTEDKYPRDRVHYLKGADRALHPIQLYKEGKIGEILITGGSGLIVNKHRDVESERLKQTMRLAGIPDSVITLETDAKNTHENAVNSKKILESKFPGQKYLLVTSAFHMRRSVKCFEQVGVTVTPFPVDFYAGEHDMFLEAIIPTVEALQVWHILFKEWMGIIAYKIMGYI